jgi:3'-5' exoribonuclease
MSRPKPIQARLSDLEPGQYADFFALLAEKVRSLTREGKAYYACRFRDARRTVSFMAWADGGRFEECESQWQVGHFYKLRAVYDEHERYGPQLVDLHQIRPANDADRDDGFDPAQLIERSRTDPAVLLAELKTLATNHIADEPLRRLVLLLLDRHATTLQRLPATRDRFHTFWGGLLEHTVQVTRTAVQLADRYRAYYTELRPPLNSDLVCAGAILHDVGHVLDFGDEPLSPSVTVPGRLAGHLILGRDLVRDAAREVPELHPERLQALEHILLTHLGLPEWGSPRLPLIPECLIVHHACDLDAKLELFVRCIARDQAPGPFTDRDPLLGRQLWKGRTV